MNWGVFGTFLNMYRWYRVLFEGAFFVFLGNGVFRQEFRNLIFEGSTFNLFLGFQFKDQIFWVQMISSKSQKVTKSYPSKSLGNMDNFKKYQKTWPRCGSGSVLCDVCRNVSVEWGFILRGFFEVFKASTFFLIVSKFAFWDQTLNQFQEFKFYGLIFKFKPISS